MTLAFTPVRMARFNPKPYIGRQLRPSQLAGHLLPDTQTWCTVCHTAIEKKFMPDHVRGKQHKLAVRKLNNLKRLSLATWETHRRAPLDEESGRTEDIEREFRHFREDQRRREEAARQGFWAEQERNNW